MVVKALLRTLRPLLNLFSCSNDTALEATRRFTFGLILLSVLVVSTFYHLVVWDINSSGLLITGLAVWCFFSSLTAIIYIKSGGNVMGRFPLGCSFVIFIAIWTADLLGSLGMITRMWSASVLLLDALLISRVEEWVGTAVLGVITLWLLVDTVEHSFRFGLYDDETLLFKYDDRGGDKCSKPPCKIGMMWGSLNMLMFVIILYLDYFITRGFAKGMYNQQRQMEKSVQLANRVATQLADFDLSGAALHLSEAEQEGLLPTEMVDAFRKLIAHLHMFRPYLPESLFEDGEAVLDDATEFSLTIVQDESSIVFTDIKGSTSLWQSAPAVMYDALRIHNDVIRECMQSHSGYEVKTIGDSFMIAFTSLQNAMNFGLAVQIGLFKEEWPEELSRLDDSHHSPSEGWNGLRIRIGVNHGEVRMERNPITKRFDYFGNIVNVASRLETACPEGALAVTQACSDELQSNGLAPHITVPLPGQQLKGVTGSTNIVVYFPEELRSRKTKITRLKKLDAPSRYESLTSSCSLLENLAAANHVATIAVLDVHVDNAVCFSERASDVVHAVQRTSGAVAAAADTVMVLSWNVSKKCRRHLEACLQCLSGTAEQPDVFSGVVCGPARLAQIGSTHHKFFTTMGPSIRLAQHLARHSLVTKTSCHFANLENGGLPNAVSSLARPAETWNAAHLFPDASAVSIYCLPFRNEDVVQHATEVVALENEK